MTTFIKAKLKKSDDQTNIDKYRVVANITEYHIISKSIFPTIIILKLMMKRQLLHIKMYVRMSQINMFKINIWTFGSHMRVDALSTCTLLY